MTTPAGVPRVISDDPRQRRADAHNASLFNELWRLGNLRFNGAGRIQLVLNDADIPATIARDSEVTAAIAALSTVYQPLDSDLTAIAALTTTAFGRSLLALADAAALTASIDVFTALLKGVVPASGGGTTNFLRADGTWAAPASGGLSDGDYGDVTVSGGGTVMTVDTGAVAYSELSGVPSDFTPSTHAASHKLAGSDVILLHEFGLPTGSVDFNKQQALSFVFENRTSDPGTPATGQVWLRTDL